MTGYIEMLAEYVIDKGLPYECYKWILDMYGIPEENEDVSFDFYTRDWYESTQQD